VIIQFLWNEEISARQIIRRVQAQFHEHAYKLQTVRFCIAEVRFGGQDLRDEICRRKSPLDDFNAKILAILDEGPFESACSISERLRVGYATVLEHLHLSIGFKSFHLRWVPHLLASDVRHKRKEHASAMLQFLYAAQRDGWYHLVTGEESESFFHP
jgi:hypothetical protein